MSEPILSIVLPVYNADLQLDTFFRSIENQNFPKKDLEVLMVDGGSTDRSLEIAHKYRVKVIHNPRKLAEPGVALGFEKAKGLLVMVLATDNIFVSNDALRNMVSVFDDRLIVGAFPKHDTAAHDTLFSRYINTFTDPFTHFVYGKAGNARTFIDIYKTIEHTSTYDIYDYTSYPVLPVIALAQGFTMRKSVLSQRNETHDDILSIYQLLLKKKKIAYVFGVSLNHFTASSIRVFMNKQSRAVDNALIRKNSGITKRNRYLTRWQNMKKYLYIPYSLSIVAPVCVSIYHYVFTGESMWLFHPVISYVSSAAILLHVASIFFRREKNI